MAPKGAARFAVCPMMGVAIAMGSAMMAADVRLAATENALPAVMAIPTHTGDLIVGIDATLMLTVQNTLCDRCGSAVDQIKVRDVLPSGLTLLSAAGSGWTCSGGSPIMCTFGGPLNYGESASIPITVAVGGDAAGTVTNTAIVDFVDCYHCGASPVTTVNTTWDTIGKPRTDVITVNDPAVTSASPSPVAFEPRSRGERAAGRAAPPDGPGAARPLALLMLITAVVVLTAAAIAIRWRARE